MSLQLRVPAVSETVDPSVETRRVYVEEWVEALPYADPAALVRTLFTSLYALNRSPLRYRTRLEILEL